MLILLLLKIFSILFVTEAVFHPHSPCPNVFSYIGSEPERDRWYGDIRMSSSKQLFNVMLELQFDRPADLLVSWLGEVTTTDNEKFTISSLSQKLLPEYPVTTRFLVKYDSNRGSPQLKVIHLNKKQICPIISNDSDKGLRRPDLDLEDASPHKDESTQVNRPASSSNNGYNDDETSYVNPLRQTPSYNNPNVNNNGNKDTIENIHTFGPSAIRPTYEEKHYNPNINNFENPSTFRPEHTTIRNSFVPTKESVHNNRGTVPKRTDTSINSNRQNMKDITNSNNSFNTTPLINNNKNTNGYHNVKPYDANKRPSTTERSNNKRLTTQTLQNTDDSNNNYGHFVYTSTYTQRTDMYTERSTTTQPSVSNQFGEELLETAGANECGQPEEEKPLALIVNGHKTYRGQWPWHVALYKITTGSTEFICGGTLISMKTIVTAAHCVTRVLQEAPVDPNSLAVYLGKHHLTDISEDEGVQTKQIRSIYVYPRYNSSTYIGDIALLILTKPVRRTSSVRQCCLWDYKVFEESIVGRNGTVVGWGLDEEERLSGDMKMTNMLVVSRDTCITSHENYFSKYTSGSTICAGNQQEESACNGDSGGGFFFKKNSRWYLRGLVSNTVAKGDKRICDTRHYVVFTDVSKYINWINEYLQ